MFSKSIILMGIAQNYKAFTISFSFQRQFQYAKHRRQQATEHLICPRKLPGIPSLATVLPEVQQNQGNYFHWERGGKVDP